MGIHPTALVSPGAQLAEDVQIGAFAIIGEHVTIGSGTVVGPHAVIEGWSTIGANNQIGPCAIIGSPPQDFSYQGEETRVLIGDANVLREHVTVHRGTQRGKGVTRIGSHGYIMGSAHVAHDCVIGDHVVLANGTVLGGHVEVGDHAVLGGLTAVHQFVKIGGYAFIGGASAVRMDISPYMLAFGSPTKLFGPNVVGLRRHQFSAEAIRALKRSYRILFRSGLTMTAAMEKVRQDVEPLPEVEHLLHFIENHSKRGVARDSV